MERADVDIVIPFHNLIDWTEECARSILANSDRSIRLILVDNASTQRLPDRIVSDSRVDVVRNRENLGWVGGVNRGLEQVQAPVTAIMNNDILVPPDWLSTMYRVATQRGDVGAVGPLQHKGLYFAADGSHRIFAQSPENARRFTPDLPVYADARSYDEFAAMVRKAALGQVLLVNRLAFFCVMMSTEVIHELGALDPQFKCGYDDNDYCRRILESGRRCAIVLDTVLYHACGTSFAQQMDNYDERLAEDRARFQRKHGLPPDTTEAPKAAA